MNDSLKFDQSTHFEFGKNWVEYSKHISTEEIADASSELTRLIGTDSLEGLSFLDIGCGSGIHSLAALMLGADKVLAIDIDPDSVETSRATIEKYWKSDNFHADLLNIFDPEFSNLPQFDVVYSWGVLHHTGAMWDAIEKANTRVAPGGQLVIAIYRKTPLCGFWKWEKRLFTSSGSFVRALLTSVYAALKILWYLLRLKNPIRKIKQYNQGKRGMHWKSDVIDWLGGYPYESASAVEIVRFVESNGFTHQYSNKTKSETGVFGSGCAEYRFLKHQPSD
jgi:SAM-dependent methyltransferase